MSKSVNPAPQQAIPDVEPVSTTLARSRVAVAVRQGNAHEEAEARQQLAESKIADAIRRELAKVPPLTPAQISRLSGLLKGGQR